MGKGEDAGSLNNTTKYLESAGICTLNAIPQIYLLTTLRKTLSISHRIHSKLDRLCIVYIVSNVR